MAEAGFQALSRLRMDPGAELTGMEKKAALLALKSLEGEEQAAVVRHVQLQVCTSANLSGAVSAGDGSSSASCFAGNG